MQRINAALILFVLLIIHPVSVQAQISPWPMFQHDQLHTGRTTVTGPATSDTLWSRSLDNESIGQNNAPVIGTTGAVLIGTVPGNVYAYTANGVRLWKTHLPGGITAPLAVALNGRILVPANNDSCYVLDPSNGHILWRAFIGQANTGGTIVGNDAFISANYSGVGFVWKLNLQALSYYWQSSHLWQIDRSSPVIGLGGQIFVGTTENILPYNSSGHISVLDVNGQEQCSYNVGFFSGRGVRSTVSQNTAGHIVGGSAGDNTSLYGGGFFINSDLTCAGCQSETGHYFSSPALRSDNAVVIGTKNGLSIRDPSGCGQIALYPTGPILNPSPVIDGQGTIYVGDDNGKLWAWSSSGINTWNRQLNAAATGIALDSRGNLYVASTLGRLYCFSGPNQTAVGPLSHPPLEQLSVRPNPVRGQATVQFTFTREATIRCAVYDLSGRPVASIFNGRLPAGTYSWTWHGRGDDGRTLPSGMYWISGTTETKRMTTPVVLLP